MEETPIYADHVFTKDQEDGRWGGGEGLFNTCSEADLGSEETIVSQSPHLSTRPSWTFPDGDARLETSPRRLSTCATWVED